MQCKCGKWGTKTLNLFYCYAEIEELKTSLKYLWFLDLVLFSHWCLILFILVVRVKRSVKCGKWGTNFGELNFGILSISLVSHFLYACIQKLKPFKSRKRGTFTKIPWFLIFHILVSRICNLLEFSIFAENKEPNKNIEMKFLQHFFGSSFSIRISFSTTVKNAVRK